MPSLAPSQPPAGPDFVAAFAANENRREARQDAHVFATICGTLADYIEDDGKREGPLLKNGVDIDEFRRALRQVRTRGWSFLTKYPALRPDSNDQQAWAKSMDAFLVQQVGTSGGPIDAAQRSKWVAAMRQLQACAQYAADRS